MQRIFMKSASFAALTLVAGSAFGQATAPTAPIQSAAVQSYDDYARFYAASKNAPIWFRSGQAAAGPELINILRRSPIEGFARGPELAAGVEAALAKAQSGDAAALIEADKTLSRAWVAYVQAIHAPTPGMLYGEKWVTPTVPTTFAVLGKALRAPVLVDHMRSVAAVNPIYSALRDAALKEAALPGGGDSARYAANLERARSIPATGKFVLVDAATARLWMYENGRPVDSMKVVVGDKKNYGLPTPMIASAIWYTTFNPYWHVPDHLAKKAAAKVLKEGHAYIKRVGYEVVDSWGDNAKVLPWDSVDWKAVSAGTAHVKLRQLPGPTNSMGKMKFNFANSEGIYLHDTPQRDYFALQDRHKSNGCIRLEDAKRLGRWLMGRDPVPPTSAAEQHVSLPQGVPVYVTYLTAQPHIGEVALTRDVYGWDSRSPVTTAAAVQAAGGGS